MKSKIIRVCFVLMLVFVALVTTGSQQAVFGQDEERGITFVATYPQLVVPIDESEVIFSLTLTNTGNTSENVQLQVDSAPDGWVYEFRSIYPENSIKAIYLPSKEMNEDDYTEDLRFRVTLPSNETPGDYVFNLKAVTSDNAIEASLPVTVTLTREIVTIKTEDVNLVPETIVVRAEVGNDFEFVVHVNNNTEKDLTFDLGAEVPPEWSVYITHGWREDRINTLMVKTGEAEDARLVVTPSPYHEPGKYPREYEVTFSVKSGEFEDSTNLRAVIDATYELILTTPSDRPQLNTTAIAGKETHIALSLYNNGSAALEDISFTSSKPEGWDITFTPDKLDSLDANAVREIDVSIKPGEKAIAGDYATVLKANSQQGSDSLDFRVTVKTSTTWGWISIIIVILVIMALLGTFATLRRR